MLMPVSNAKSGNKRNKWLKDKVLALSRTIAIKSSEHSLTVFEKYLFWTTQKPQSLEKTLENFSPKFTILIPYSISAFHYNKYGYLAV